MSTWQSFIDDGIFLSPYVDLHLALIDGNITNRTDPAEQNLIDCWNFKFDDEAHYWGMHHLMTMTMIVVIVGYAII